MIWVTAEDVVAIHSRIIQVSGGIDGLRDRAGLEAAIACTPSIIWRRRSFSN